MLGLGTSVTNIDSGQIYRELSELDRFVDLNLHFDFSILTGVHGSEVTAAPNLPSSAFDIISNNGTPTLDRGAFGGRSTVAFAGEGDYLNLGREFTSSNKSFTFFIVFQRADDESLAITGSSVITSVTNYIKFTGEGTEIETVMGEDDGALITTLASDDNSTVDYTQVTGVPSVLVMRRDTGGMVYVYADNGILIAVGEEDIKTAMDFRLLTIGGNVGLHPSTTYKGNIGEVGMYDTDIGEADAITLSKELSTKWGVNRRS